MKKVDGLALAQFLERPLHGGSKPILRIEAFPNQTPFSLSFLSREVSEALSPAPEGALVIAPSGARAALLDAGYAVIESSVPKYDLARAFHAVIKETPEPGIHPSAVIEGPVKLGEGVIIGPGCVLQGRVEVGDGCRLGAHVCLLNDVTLGKEVRILNGALIGEDATRISQIDHKYFVEWSSFLV
jgi:UDP-3-O-[3-hydroxymyristoyl] glucosamine N-acyltransferase